MLPATSDDACELVPLLRADDRLEVLALGLDPIEGLLQSLSGAHEAWTYRAEGQIVCIGGITSRSLIGRIGVPWLLGSELVVRHRRSFMVETRRAVARWLTHFDALTNIVDARYDAAIRWLGWLGWLGFEIGEPFPLANGRFRVVHKEAV